MKPRPIRVISILVLPCARQVEFVLPPSATNRFSSAAIDDERYPIFSKKFSCHLARLRDSSQATSIPGVFEKEKATILAIAQSTNLEDYDIHIPSQENRKTLQGVLQYSDGKPVVSEFVEFRADQVKEGLDGEVHTSTDDHGRFTLPVLEGLKGTLRGFMYTYEGEFVNCPQLDKLIKAQGGKMPDVGTKPMPLEITRDMQDIKLTFPFPYCKKAKEEK